MRIDFQSGPPAAPENDRTSLPNNPGASRVSGPNSGGDQAQLSGAHVQVTALAAAASQLPEIREERVQALREAVVGGGYHPNPDKIASAMLAHMVSGPAA